MGGQAITAATESPRSGRHHLGHGEAVGKGRERKSASPRRGGIWNFIWQNPNADCTRLPLNGARGRPLQGSVGKSINAVSFPRLARRGLQDVAPAVASDQANSFRLTIIGSWPELRQVVPWGLPDKSGHSLPFCFLAFALAWA
jgi:hypothetical protein